MNIDAIKIGYNPPEDVNTIIEVPIGVLKMEDDGGGDEKIIAVPTSKITLRHVNVKSYADLPEITRQQIEHFFVHYKDLEPGKWVKLQGWGGVDEARKLISDAIAREQAARAKAKSG